jgi:hypothetical protein
VFVVVTIADVRCLREARAAPAALLDEIEASLRDLHERLGGGVDFEDFSVADFAPVLIAQPGDGPGVFAALGVPEGVESRPEWVGRGEFGGEVHYQVVVLRGNNKAVSLFVPAGALDGARRARLDREADEG